MWQKAFCGCVGMMVLCGTSLVWAQEGGFDVETFEPLAGATSTTLNLSSSEVLGHQQFAVGTMLHMVDGALRVYDRQAGEFIEGVDYQFKGELLAGIGLWDRAEIGMALPVAFVQSGEGVSAGTNFSSSSLADLRLMAKYALLRQGENSPVGLALQGQVWVPVGDEATYTSDGAVRVEPRLAMDWRRGGWRVGANLAYRYRPTREVFNYVGTSALRWGVGGEAPIWETRLALITSIFGDVATQQVELSRNNPAEALVGLRYYLTPDFTTEVGGGGGLTPSVGSPNFRVFASVIFRPSQTSSGLEEEPMLTSCEDDPEGCRPAAVEIVEKEEVVAAPEPEPVVEPEPEPEPEPVIEPEPEPVVAPEPEPEVEVVVVRERTIEVNQNIFFDTNEATIKAESRWLVAEIAGVLQDNPQLTRVRVEGHTDSRASEAYNLRLSERRAAAVVEELISFGVAPQRLESLGLGQSRPIASNETIEGMARNRRVEFHIVSIDGEPIPAERTVTIEGDVIQTR